MPKIFWFKFCPADWLKDTQHLDRCEEGSYLLLCLHYYVKRKPLPDNDKRLAAIAKCPPSEWPATREVLAEFFIIEQGVWKHKRIEEALQEQAAESKKQSDNANKRWHPEKSLAYEYGLVDERAATADAKPLPKPIPNASMLELQSKLESESESKAKASNILLAPVEGEKGKKKPSALENNLMTRLRMFLGNPLMEEHGGLWRVLVRESPLTVGVVIDDMESQMKEGKTYGCLHAAAYDLFKRLKPKK